jgi:tRNA1(Val) A37 N6-methylase TrmN6
MVLNNIFEYQLYHCRVQDLSIDKVDVIVCNPPYFKSGRTKENINLANARHANTLSIYELIENSKRLLKENGRFMMVYKSCDLADVISALDLNGFGIIRLQFIFDENKENSSCFLLEACKNKKHNIKVLKSIVITH